MTCQGVCPVATTRNPASRAEAGAWAVGGQGTTNKSWGWLQHLPSSRHDRVHLGRAGRSVCPGFPVL